MINRVLVMLCVLCTSFGVQAHQPDISSTMLVEQEDNHWVLQIRAALTAFEYEIENHYGKSSYATPEEFQALVLKHVQENTSIRFNALDKVQLTKGKVKLGHETSVSFEVIGTPEQIQTLVVINSSFSHLNRNQSALIVLKKGFSKDQFTLNNDNDHTVELHVKDTKFELLTPYQTNTRLIVLVCLAIFFILVSIFFVFKRSRKNEFAVVPINI